MFDGMQTELQRPEKMMVGVCSCDSCFGTACGKPREGLKGLKGLKAFEGKQTAGLNAQQMAIVAGGLRKGLKGLRGLKGLKAGKRQS